MSAWRAFLNLINSATSKRRASVAGRRSKLGPVIVATKGKPVRILFRSPFPAGEGGGLFLPVDSSMMGSGMGQFKDTPIVNGTAYPTGRVHNRPRVINHQVLSMISASYQEKIKVQNLLHYAINVAWFLTV